MTLEQWPLSKFVPYGRHPCTNDWDAVLEGSGETFEQTQSARRLSIPGVR